jgi:DNA-binding transcriptional MerR regulator
MDGYTISEVAERTGFPATTLRFYEDAGLVHPARSAAGYRLYDERDLELLDFIGRAKGLGLSLEEIADLLVLLDEERCGPVQERLRDLVGGRIADAHDRIAELVAFTAELQQVTSALERHTPDGPCDVACGCWTDAGPPEPGAAGLLEPEPETGCDALACTLDPNEVAGRLADWRASLGAAVGREAVEGGVRVRFSADVDVADLAALVVAENDCCQFFTFGLTIGAGGVALDVTGPPDAQPVITALVGAPS